jgi:hypothetical protein
LTALLIARLNKLVDSATNALSSTGFYLQEGVTFIERALNHTCSAALVFFAALLNNPVGNNNGFEGWGESYDKTVLSRGM